MFGLSGGVAVYLHRAPIDFRKGINGLVVLIEHGLQLNPFMAACFVFGNKRRDRIKILYWQRNGFWLCQKRLEQDRFVWPRTNDTVVQLSLQQMQWLLDGMDLNAMRRHPERHFLRAN